MGEDSVYLRRVEQSDVDILYEWVNDGSVRKSSFDTHVISYEEHLKWFDQVMNNHDDIQYVLMKADSPIGQVRFSRHGRDVEIDYSICRTNRGRGYGGKIIELAIVQAKKDFPNAERLIGKVKPSNVASYNCFSKNGFVESFRQLEYDMESEH